MARMSGDEEYLKAQNADLTRRLRQTAQQMEDAVKRIERLERDVADHPKAVAEIRRLEVVVDTAINELTALDQEMAAVMKHEEGGKGVPGWRVAAVSRSAEARLKKVKALR